MRETDLQERSERGGEKKKACLFFLLLLLLIFIGPISFRASLIPFLALSRSRTRGRVVLLSFILLSSSFQKREKCSTLFFWLICVTKRRARKRRRRRGYWCHGRGRLYNHTVEYFWVISLDCRRRPSPPKRRLRRLSHTHMFTHRPVLCGNGRRTCLSPLPVRSPPPPPPFPPLLIANIDFTNYTFASRPARRKSWR